MTSQEFIQETAEDFKESVGKIESSLETTQNHYGDYLQILTPYVDQASWLILVAASLIRAGANKTGVLSAVKILKP